MTDHSGRPDAPATLTPAVRELLAVLRDLLDVPMSALTEQDEREYHALMRRRITEAHVALDVALSPRWANSTDPAAEAARLRARLDDMPVTYTLWQDPAQTEALATQAAPAARMPDLCPPCKRGECDECMAVDHPDLPGLYACHYVDQPHHACRQARVAAGGAR